MRCGLVRASPCAGSTGRVGKMTSENPALSARGLPAPKSTRKFELARGRSQTAARGLLDFEALVGKDDLLDRDAVPLAVERPAAVLDDPRAQQLPGHDGGRVLLVLELD